MTTLVNGFESQPAGAAVTASNSGGNGADAFDIVTVTGTGNSLTYSSTKAHNSINSGVFTLGANSGTLIAGWSTSLTSSGGSGLTQIWWRLYAWISAFPSSNYRIAQFRNTSGGLLCFIEINNSGKLLQIIEGGATQTTTTTAVPLNAWWRAEGTVIGSTTVGQMIMSTYFSHGSSSVDSTVPVETDTGASGQDTGGPLYQVVFGNPSTNYTLYLDDLGVSTTGYLGPAPKPGGATGAHTIPALIAAGIIG